MTVVYKVKIFIMPYDNSIVKNGLYKFASVDEIIKVMQYFHDYNEQHNVMVLNHSIEKKIVRQKFFLISYLFHSKY